MKICHVGAELFHAYGWTVIMKLIIVFKILQTCLMMRIWISVIVIKYFVSFKAQALLGFWIQWVQVKGVLLNVGEGVKLGCGPI
jgi:hypothetical protein